SSLATVLSSALVFSTRPPESVCGTVTERTHYEVFLGSLGSTTSPGPKTELVVTSRRWRFGGFAYRTRVRACTGISDTRLAYPSSSPLRSNVHSVVQEY